MLVIVHFYTPANPKALDLITFYTSTITFILGQFSVLVMNKLLGDQTKLYHNIRQQQHIQNQSDNTPLLSEVQVQSVPFASSS